MDLLEVGKIINTHGLRGEVKVSTWTDVPETFEDLDIVYFKKNSELTKLTITAVKYQKNNIIVKFRELNDISEAETLKNYILFAQRADLGELPEGAYYIADLIGLNVRKENGELLGTLTDVLQTGASDIYVVSRSGQKDLLIPVIDEVVLDVDINSGITVRLMEGLEDL